MIITGNRDDDTDHKRQSILNENESYLNPGVDVLSSVDQCCCMEDVFTTPWANTRPNQAFNASTETGRQAILCLAGSDCRTCAAY